MNRGEVWTAATGSGFGSKPRPVVIVQDPLFANTPNTIVALCHTARARSDDIRPRILPDLNNGLREMSDLAVDVLVTVPRHKFGERIGQLSSVDMQRVDQSLLLLLGFA